MTDSFHGGLSCEPAPDEETSSLCDHGAQIKFGCLLCAPTLGDLIISLNNKVEQLREHKVRQIDENRKISRRVDEVEKSLEHYREYKTGIEDLETDVMRLNERIVDVLEELENSDNERLDKLENSYNYESILDLMAASREFDERIDKLEEEKAQAKEVTEYYFEINRRLKEIENWKDFIMKSIVFSKDKKPHKCPVCEGKCKKMFELPSGGYYEIDCKSCDGKGIVWE